MISIGLHTDKAYESNNYDFDFEYADIFKYPTIKELATKTKRQKMSRRTGAYADKTCEAGVKKLLPYGN